MSFHFLPTLRGIATACAALAALSLPTTPVHARAARAVAQHEDGSTTARAGLVRARPAGGGVARGRTVTTDGAGNTSMHSAAAVVTPGGGTGVRRASNTGLADGSATHQSSMAAQGAQGSVSSSGSAARAADGSITQSRSTTATSAATGHSVQAQSSYSKDTGLAHSATCYDAGGAAMACPSRP